jgi:WD40 repeat protein
MGNDSSPGRPRLLAHGQTVTALVVDATSAFWAVREGAIFAVDLRRGRVTTLRAGGKGALQECLAVDATHVYWLSSAYREGGVLYRAPRDGGAAETLATDVFASSFALHAGHLFWVDPAKRALMRLPAPGGEAVALTKIGVYSREVVRKVELMHREEARIAAGGGQVFWTGLFCDELDGEPARPEIPDQAAYSERRRAGKPRPEARLAVWRAPVSGGAAERIAVETMGIQALAADDDFVIWSVYHKGTPSPEHTPIHAELKRAPARGGEVVTLARDLDQSLHLALRDGVIYAVGTFAGALLALPIAGGTPRPLAPVRSDGRVSGGLVAVGPGAVVWSSGAGNLFALPHGDEGGAGGAAGAGFDLGNHPEDLPEAAAGDATSAQEAWEAAVDGMVRRREPPERTVERVRVGFEAPFRSYWRVTHPAGRDHHRFVLAVSHFGGGLLDAFGRASALDLEEGSAITTTCVYPGEPPPDELVAAARNRGIDFESGEAFGGLPPWTDVLAKQRAHLDTGAGRGLATAYLTPRFEPLRARCSEDGAVIDDAAAELVRVLTGQQGAFVLLTGDASAGKTFLLREVLRVLAGRFAPSSTPSSEVRVPPSADPRVMAALESGPAPLLIDVTAAMAKIWPRDHLSIDTIIAAHFQLLGVSKVDSAALRDALAGGRAVLLLDHADGGLPADHATAPGLLAEMWRGLPATARVVVACRKTDFATRAAELEALRIAAPGVAYARTWEVLPLDRGQIRRALGRHMASETEAAARFAQLEGDADLLALVASPVFLSAFAALPEQTFEANDGPRVLDAVLQQAVWRSPVIQYRLGARSAMQLARWMWTQGVDRIEKMALPEPFLEQLRDPHGDSKGPGEAARKLGNCGYLGRDAAGSFAFVQRSLAEWLVARDLAENLSSMDGHRPFDALVAPLAAARMSPRMARFFAAALAGDANEKGSSLHRLVEWARGAAVSPATDPIAADNARALLQALGIAAPAPVPSAFAAPMSDRSFAGQRLRGADLHGKNLGNADFSGADLSFANLLDADLRGARLDGASLRAAKLLGARLDPGALSACDTFGAALSLPEQIAPMSAITEGVHAVAFHPSGRFVATSHFGGLVQLWNAETGACLRSIRAGGSNPCLAFSPDGSTLATGSHGVQLWDVCTGAAKAAIPATRELITAVAWRPGGVASVSGAEPAEAGSASAKTAAGRGVASVSGVLATASIRAFVRLYDAATLTEQHVLPDDGDGSEVGLAWSGDGARLATSLRRTVRIWDPVTGQQLRAIAAPGPLLAVALSPDGRLVAGSGEDAKIHFWDTEMGALVRSFRVENAWFRGMAFSPDWTRLAIAANDRAVLVDAVSGALLHTFRGRYEQLRSVAFSPDATLLAGGPTTDGVGAAPLWDTATGEPRCTLRGHADVLRDLAFSDDGRALRVEALRTTAVWDVALQAPLPPGEVSGLAGRADARAHALPHPLRSSLRGGGLRKPVFSADGGVVAASDRGKLTVWDARTGAQRATIAVEDGFGREAWALRPDGAQVVTADPRAGLLRFWDAATGAPLHTLEGAGPSALVFSADGKTLAVGGSRLRFLDSASGEERASLATSSSLIALHPGGTLVATGRRGGTVRLWDLPSGACIAELLSLPDGWCSFTADGHVKHGGQLHGLFWHAIGLARFEPGELDPYLAEPLLVPAGTPLPGARATTVV